MKRSHTAPFFRSIRHTTRALNWCLVVLLTTGSLNTTLQAQAPSGGIVRAGDATITGEGTASTRIDQRSARAIIDWRQFSIGADGRVVFAQPTSDSATLNRVTGAQVSVILGQLDANGQVLLINPNGIVFGGGAQVNVGSLIATTSNISDTNFLGGRLVFDQPGTLGAGILNAGAITARDGGLVALVAPHVRNDGLLAARLGTVVLGSADTFTVDLYGDALINLALSNGNAGQLVGLDGRPVTSLVSNTGHIDTGGGQTVLMTARGAKAVLDNLINMSGTIRADQAVEQNGRILLLGEGGTVDVSGALGASSGTIQVLGDQVHLSGTAALDASGDLGGGTVEVGGAFQGRGDTYRSTQTTVEAGATLKANATQSGDGGDVVVWSDGNTAFAGAVEARGGAVAGNGGRMEVSGKGTLDFLGQADASALNGQSGSLLLDPAYMTIGAAEASTITRVLRTGTTTNLQADVDIDVNSAIFGGDREEGGGLNMTAGNNINVNDFIVTNNGAINMTATGGTVTVADGKAVFAGNAPITVNANGNLSTGPMLTSGSLSIRSVTGSVAVNSFIDDHTGPVSIKAAGNVDINQSIVNLVNGSTLTVDSGQDVNVNAQVDGRGGVAGGAVSMTAARDVNVNQAVVTNNGAVALTATNGALNVGSGAPLVSGTGEMALTARSDVSTGAINAGALAITSSAGTANINGVIDSATGETRINASADVNLNQAVLNGQTGSALAVTAGRDVNVNAVIDGRSGVAGGSVGLTATRNVNVNDYVVTNNGTIGVTATTGTLTVASGKGTFAGSGGIALRAAGDVTTGAVSGGSLAATSTGGAVNINGVIDGSTGRVDLTAAADVNVNQGVLNTRTGNAFNATAGRDVNLNAIVDGRGGATGGAVNLKASRDVTVSSAIVTNDGSIGIAAASGAATMAARTALVSGTGAIAVSANRDVTLQGISGGSLTATSANGSVIIDGVIDGRTGRVDLAAGRDVAINAPILNTRTGSSLNAAAGRNVNVNAQIDGTTGASGGAVNLAANQNVNVNAVIATHDAAIRLTATNGTAAFGTGTGLYAGSGTIAVDGLGSIVTPTLSGGAMQVSSRASDVTIGGQMAGDGAMAISAAGGITISNAVTNAGAGSALTVNAGTNVIVNAAVGRPDAVTPSGSVTMTAGQNIVLNDSIVTGGGAISLTATAGAVTTAPAEGLYAGTADIAVDAHDSIVMPTFGTTGSLTVRSTAGAVTVNQDIGNSRGDASVTLTAATDLTVNGTIDARDADVPTRQSGAVTLSAGHDVTFTDDLVTVDGDVSISAAAGAVNWAAGKGIYTGSGDISVASSSTLDTGLLATTGTLRLASGAGDLNLNHAVDDTTGEVTLTAGQTVNIDHDITNLKSGANLTVTAGQDINVIGKVDGRDGAAAGGMVTMTAGRDLQVSQFIATNNGEVSLTATTGSVTLPTATEVVYTPVNPLEYSVITTPMEASVIAGSADVSITSGGAFNLTSPVATTGSLTITSTNGTITTSAPIADTTGAVTLSAGDALVLNREVKSANQAIALNAGSGGITVNVVNDYDHTHSAAINAGSGDLTMSSVGDVSILEPRGIASSGTLTIDTRGQITTGSVGYVDDDTGRPSRLVLNADQGIVTFSAGQAGDVTATSSNGSIYLRLHSPMKLRVITGTPGTTDCPTCNITLVSDDTHGLNSLGPDTLVNAGGSVSLGEFFAGTLHLIARAGDVTLDRLGASTLTVEAGRDVTLTRRTDGGPITLQAGRDINTSVGSPITLWALEGLTVSAGRDVTLHVVQMMGPASITAQTGNITLHNPLGPHVIVPDGIVYNPDDLGIASLTMSAPAATATIDMQGVRAEGDISISTGGNLTSAREIVSVHGEVSLDVDGTTEVHNEVPIGNEPWVGGGGGASPVVPPGPKSPLPGQPGIAGNGAAGLPAFSELSVSAANQDIGAIQQPGTANGAVTLGSASTGGGIPGANSSATGRPAVPVAGVLQASGASDPAQTDTASALRTAGQSCGQVSDPGQTGLDAVVPAVTAGTPGADDAASASCPPVSAAAADAARTSPAPNPGDAAPVPPAGVTPESARP